MAWRPDIARGGVAAGLLLLAAGAAVVIRLPGRQEELILRIAATGKPVVVVLVGGSAVTMSRWLDRVNAVIDAWYPGEEGGNAVADVIFGDANPSGRLPRRGR